MKCLRRRLIASGTGVLWLVATGLAQAHTGPPFPIVSNRSVGPYDISVWTDPDSTDDGSAGGQFWITVRPLRDGELPSATRVEVAVTPLGKPGSTHTASAEPIATDLSRRFAALVMDHEGRFHVRVTVQGPLGDTAVEAEVDATYDMRPSSASIVVLLLPFAVIGILWVKILLRRRKT